MPTEIDQTQPADDKSSEETFEAWLAAQDDKVKGLYTAHTGGLTSALAAEREANKKSQNQLRELAKKAEKGSELEVELTKQADALKTSEKRATFMDKAHSAGVRSLKLAFLAASEAGMVKDDGDCDFVKLRADYPELFAAAQSVHAGDGTGGQGQQKSDMNVTLRKAFGIQ
jgi:hypothetical protein